MDKTVSEIRKPNKPVTKTRGNVQEETFITNASTFISASSHTFGLMARAHFKGSSFYLGNVLIPILVATGVGAFMPMAYGFIWVLFIAITFSGLSTYGTVFFTIRKSTIIKNINMTANETGSLYFSTFLLLGVSMFATMLVIIEYTMFLDLIGYSMYSLSYYSGDPSKLWYVSWPDVFLSGGLWYYWIEQIFLCFSLSFFVEKVVSTQKNFFIFALIYIVAGIFFSGMISNTLYINSDGMVDVVHTGNEENLSYDVVMAYQWGQPLWIIGQFFPHFGANQLVANVSQQASWHYGWINTDGTKNVFDNTKEIQQFTNEKIYSPWKNISILDSLSNIETEYYAFMPWIWAIVLTWGAGTLERFNKN